MAAPPTYIYIYTIYALFYGMFVIGAWGGVYYQGRDYEPSGPRVQESVLSSQNPMHGPLVVGAAQGSKEDPSAPYYRPLIGQKRGLQEIPWNGGLASIFRGPT